jgi:hypothetical protein
VPLAMGVKGGNLKKGADRNKEENVQCSRFNHPKKERFYFFMKKIV